MSEEYAAAVAALRAKLPVTTREMLDSDLRVAAKACVDAFLVDNPREGFGPVDREREWQIRLEATKLAAMAVVGVTRPDEIKAYFAVYRELLEGE